MEVTVSPVCGLRGSLSVPGDKSISHRGLILGAMARGRCVIRGAAPGADVGSTRECLERLGVSVSGGPGSISPCLVLSGPAWVIAPAACLDAGNSGTTMRLLAGALAGRRGSYVLSGDASLSARPMQRVAVPLRQMGATVELGERGTPPIRLSGGDLRGIAYDMPVASAQVKSAILLAGLQADGPTTVTEPGQSRDHTERFLSWLGLPLRTARGSVTLGAGRHLPLPAFTLDVPGDFSSAAFWIAAASLVPGSDLTVENVGLNPSRTGFLQVLAAMGAAVEADPDPGATGHPEPIGSVRVRSADLQGTEVAGAVVANAIDELPVVAVAATQAEGTTVIRDAAELRVKESDRVAVLARGLRELGADVEEAADGMVVHGPTRLRGGTVDAGGDHRMALAFAVAAMVATGPVTILGWESTTISYPGFLDDLAKLSR